MVLTIGRRSQICWLAFLRARETACSMTISSSRAAPLSFITAASARSARSSSASPNGDSASPGRPMARTSMSLTILPRLSMAKLTISTPLVEACRRSCRASPCSVTAAIDVSRPLGPRR
jgi:hypothetical protein